MISFSFPLFNVLKRIQGISVVTNVGKKQFIVQSSMKTGHIGKQIQWHVKQCAVFMTCKCVVRIDQLMCC